MKVSPYVAPGVLTFIPIKNLTEQDLPMIIKVVEHVTEVNVRNIKGKLTSTHIATARHLFIGISVELCNVKQSKIMKFVNRSRFTFRNSYKTFSDLILTDEKVKEQYQRIKDQLFIVYN